MSYAYKVLQKDSLLHAVEIPNCPRPGETQYGYVFFDKSARPTDGAVKRVNRVSSLIGCARAITEQNAIFRPFSFSFLVWTKEAYSAFLVFVPSKALRL